MPTLSNPLAPRFRDDSPGPSAKAAAAWMDLMEACEQLLQAGLRQEIGPDGDLKAAYRAWYTRQMQRRDEERRQRWEGAEAVRGRYGV